MTDAIQIDAISPAHLAVAGALFEAAFDEPYGLPAVTDLLKAASSFGLIASTEEPAGFVIASIAADEAEIISIGVVPDQRKRGVGRALLQAVIEKAAAHGVATLYLEVGADNPGAAAFYDAFGFHQVGLRRNYYRRAGGRRVDARILALKIAHSTDGGTEPATIP